MRSLCTRVLVALSILIVPTFAFASVTISGTTTFAALDGGPDDADHTVNGVFTVNGDLTVNGTINCNDASSGAGSSACPMQFVVSGNLTLSAGSGVFAENRASDGNGANITFTVGGDVLIQGTNLSTPGAIVSSSKLNGGNPAHAGDITINAGGAVTQGAGSILAATAIDSNAGAISVTAGTTATMGGEILSGCSRTLTTSTLYTNTIMGGGGGGHYVGGPITIRAFSHSEPGLVVTSSAIIASQGSETLPVTGNPVTLEGCGVQINGLVASLAGQGSGAGVIIRSGTTLTIDSSTLTTSGSLHRASIRSSAWHESAAAMYVKLEAAKDIAVIGPTSTTLFSVSSNPGTIDKMAAGTITVISTGGGITASGNAFQAADSQNGDQGGTVSLSSKNDQTLNGATIAASGSATDGARAGGHINVRSYSGAVNWQSGVGDVRPSGSTAGIPVALQGTISLTYCTTLSTSGTSFPTSGSPVGVFPTTAQNCSPSAPSLPAGDTLPSCNQPPVANNTSATTNEDNSVTITMTASDPDGDSITFTIVTPPAHGNLGAIFNQTPTSAQVTYTPNANYNGSDSFTFQADDGKGGTSIGTVTITINPVNDPPTFNLGANPVSSNEDAGPQSIANYASSISPGPTPDEQTQTVTFTVTNDNNALFSAQPAISPSGTLTYTSAPNANGSANVMVVAHDNGGTANGGNDTSTTHNFNIVVNPVNDAPSFTPGPNVTVLDTDGAYSAGWATSISAGPPDESGQTLNFIVNNDNNALFSVQPAISPSGVLTFTPIAGQSGVANVTVQLHDNGGTANGGVDTSAPVTFTVTVDKIPVITSANNTTFVVGTFGTFTVTASARPPADIFESGPLPTGVGFVNNGPPSSTGTLSGTPAVGTGGVYNITFTATNVHGSSAPQAFTLTVNEAPTVGTNPSDQAVCAGATASFSASAATGFPAPAVQWQISTDGGATFSNIPGATSTTYSFATSVSDNGHKFRAVFTNGSGSAATSAATLTVNTAPVVTTNPASQIVCAGTAATFTAAATASPAATVQWQISTDSGTTWSDISGATSATYSFTTAATDNGGQYRAVFTNVCGSATTSAATLTVDTLPAVTTNPVSQTVCSGATVTFTAAATSNASDHTVQWQVSTDGGTSWSDISGATSTTYSFTTANGDNGKQYRAVFTDACGSANTSAALLTVDSLPSVTTNPVSQTVCSGASATFTAAASSNAGDQTVQWQVSTNGGSSWSNIPGATSTTLSFATANGDNGKQYRAVFTDSCGSTSTAAATLTVDTLPVVTTNPLSQTVCAGATAAFTAAATSNANDHTVQWQVSSDGGTTFSNIPGATSTTLSFATAAGDNGKQYRAVFTDACGSTATSAAVLTVDTLPVVSVQPSDTTVCVGATASFTSTATSNAGDHTVQWQVSTDGGTTFNNIPGATSTTYSFTTGAGDTGNQYRAVFTDSCGSTSSNAATLTVNTPPAITGNPANTIVCENSIASFTASASATPAATVQWQLSTDSGTTFNDIPGATNATYSFTAMAGDTGNQYRAVFTNACGSSTTTAATLTVDTQPVVTTNPSDTSAQTGSTATFTAAASGTPAPTVQWQVSTDGGTTFADIPGATSTTYSFTAQQSDNGKKFRAVFTNTCGSATTTAATLTVTCPTITITRTGGGSFPAATYGVGYPAGNAFTATCSGCTGTIHWSFQTGARPPGINLTIVAGTLSGIPSATGQFTMTVIATDTGTGCSGTASFPFTIKPDTQVFPNGNATGQSYSNLVNNTQAYVTGGVTATPSTPAVQLSGTIVAGDNPSNGVTIDPSGVGTFATSQGGSVNIAADGTFLYTPPLTDISSDTFNYIATSNTGTVPSIPQYAPSTGPAMNTGTITLNLANRVWYVNNSGANGNGQSQSPFNTLANFTSGSRVSPDTSGDIIFVHTGDGTTTNQNAGVTLLANEQLIGNGVALVVNGNALAAAGTNPQITNSAVNGDAVTLDDGDTVKGLTITGATRDGISGTSHAGFTGDTLTIQNNTGSGLHLTNMTGTVTVTSSTITGNAIGLDVNNGTAAISLDNTNTITANAGQRQVSIQNRTGSAGAIALGATINDSVAGSTGILVNLNNFGTITFSGSQTLRTTTNTAVALTSNPNTTINFSGALGITTTTGSGFTATGGGTLNVTGAANVTTGAAANGVNINGVTVGVSGVTFANVNTTGATTGVALASIGNGNVTIDGGTISGGTTGISLSNLGTSATTLSGVTITGATTGISGSTFGTLAISGSAVNVSGAIALNLSTGAVSGTFADVSSTGDSNGVNLNGVTGNWGTTAGTLTGATGATFNVTGGSGGTITWGGAISQANAANVVTISGSNSNTINFNGNVTSSGTSTGLSIGGSSGTYNFNGTNTFSGAGGITLGAAGESGTIGFSSNTTNTTAGTPFLVDGTTGNVTAAITYSGTINKASAGTLISVNKLVSPGTLTMSHSPAATGNLTQSGAGANAGISITNSTSTNITIANASVTVNNSAAAFTSSGNSGTINLQGIAFTANGNKAGMLISGGGTINISDGAASSSINASGGTARAIDGSTTSYTGTLNLTNATVTGNATGGVFLTSSTLGGTGGTITGSGPALTLNTVALTNGAGMTSVSSSGGANGISLTNCTGGTYIVSAGTITGNSGSSFLVSGGSATFAYNGTLAQSNAQRVVNISGIIGGALTLGPVTGSASCTGITAGGTGGTVTFGGVITLNGASDTFTASDSGGLTVVANAAGNTIGSTTNVNPGPAVTISNVSIGAGGVKFQSIKSTGGVNGIALSNTGVSGSFSVTANGGTCSTSANCTGGFITNTTGAGVTMTNTLSPSFDRIFIQNTAKSGVSGTTVQNFTLTNSTIDTSGTDHATPADDSNVSFGFATAGTEKNVYGTVVITGNTLTNSWQHGIFIQNFDGNITDAQIQNNTITSSNVVANSNGSGIQLLGFGSASTVSGVTKAEITGNTVNNFPSGAGITAQFGNPSGSNGTWGTPGTANVILIQSNKITGDSTNKMNTNAILGTMSGNGNAYWKIDSNGTVANPITNMKGAAIAVTTRATSAVTSNTQADISNNVIVANNVLGSQGIAVGITNVAANTTDAPQLSANITNNSVSASSGQGIDALANACSGLLKIKIQNNTVGAPTQASTFAIEPRQGSTAAGGAPAICLNISGNTATGNAVTGIGIRKQSGQTWAFGVDSLPGGDTATPNFEAYINSLNPAANGTTLISATSGFSSCSNP